MDAEAQARMERQNRVYWAALMLIRKLANSDMPPLNKLAAGSN